MGITRFVKVHQHHSRTEFACLTGCGEDKEETCECTVSKTDDGNTAFIMRGRQTYSFWGNSALQFSCKKITFRVIQPALNCKCGESGLFLGLRARERRACVRVRVYMFLCVHACVQGNKKRGGYAMCKHARVRVCVCICMSVSRSRARPRFDSHRFRGPDRRVVGKALF